MANASDQGLSPVSLCLIVRNEAHHLARCLRSAADLVGEMIVVDTGSTDRTREIAAQLGARVYDFAWCDSFAAARNESIRHAIGDWIFWLDADECLDDVNRERLRALFARLPDANVAYTMAQRSVLEASTHSTAVVHHVRLFRNHPAIRWQYRVHEQILPSIRAAGGDLCHTDVVIDHAGFQEPALQEGKVERNLRLLLLELQEQPHEPFVLFNLASVYLGRGQAAQALPHLRRSLELSHPGDSILRKLWALIARAHHQLGQLPEALTACRSGRQRFPEEPELLFWEALLLRDHGDLNGAETHLRRLLAMPPGVHLAGADEGMQSYKARVLLGEIYRQQGRLDEAEAQWRQVLAERPNYVPVWQRLAELFADQGRWSELDQAIPHLREDSNLAFDAAVLNARSLLARRMYVPARQELEIAIARTPQALVPRILLAHVLLQEGRAPAAAEEALRAVLRLDPRQEESWRNLVTLLRHEGRLAEALAACEAGQMYCPGNDDLALLEALVLHERGDRADAEACLRRLLAKPEAMSGSSPPARQRLKEARHHLAVLCREQGRHNDAAAQWQSLVAAFPDHTPAWLELGESYLAEGRWAELDQVARRLEADPQQKAEAHLYRARAHLARGEFTPAREILQRLIAADPRSPKPRVALSYAYLQEGSDWAAAEQALRDVLTLDPNHAEARHNLKVLLEQRGHLPMG